LREYDVKEFRRKYPHLAEELEEGVGVKSIKELVEGAGPPFMPTAVDYLRRCSSLEEAMEVLEYLARTGQLREEERRLLEEKLVNEGLESLGPRKEFGYYSEKYLKDIDLKSLQRRLP